jgi:hypothetical protein
MMNNKSRSAGVFQVICLVAGMLVSGCAAMQEQWASENCTKDAGYAQGMNDARGGEQMKIQNYSNCPDADRETALAAYRSGYQAGIAADQPQATTVVNSGPLFQIGGPRGIQIGAPGTTQTQVARNDKAWFCEVNPFSDHYEGFAATQLEGKKAVSADCRTKHGEMFCDDVKCRRNQ